MKSVKILIDNKIPFIHGALDDIAELKYMDGSRIRSSDVKEMDALIIRTRTVCNEKLLAGSSVRFIATATIGFDHIDTVYCQRKGISWTNAPGCNSSSVEQYFVSAILELSARRIISPEGLTLGIIGVGNVGSKVARVAEVLGMRVLLNDPPRARAESESSFVSLEMIRKESDMITFHVPLNMEGADKTYKIADDHFFNSLAKKVHLINTSRGSVIDESALLTAIKRGKIRSCILDVWENEPFIKHELLQAVDIATPHIAGYSTDGKANGTTMSVQAVSRFFKLGRDNWKPANLPPPGLNPIKLDCMGLGEMDILRNVYKHTYSIVKDDAMLRADVPEFESLRGNYRIRREPAAFSVVLQNNNYEDLPRKLEKLGFSVLS